jgi:hypothetical protein
MDLAVGRTLKSYPAAIVLLAALLLSVQAHAAGSCVTVELFLYNLTSNPITVSWVDKDGNSDSESVNGQTAFYIGQECINVSKENAFQLKVSDPDSGLPNAEYTIDAEHCNPENWQNALNNYPLCDADGNSPLLSYNIYKDDEFICLQGPASNPLSPNESPNSAVGVTSVSASCPTSGVLSPMFSTTFNSGTGPFTWPLALGTYAPTAGPVSAVTLPGLSPAGVTVCLGTNCVIPNHDNDYNYWPVTIYWYGSGEFHYNDASQFQPATTYANNFNIPSHLSSYGYEGVDDVYVPPGTADIQLNGSQFPAPCWPTFDATTGDLSSCAPNFSLEDGTPAYLANPNASSGTAKKALTITKDVVKGVAAVAKIAF